MRGLMALFCLLACAWMVYRTVAGYMLVPGETLALSAIMANVAVWFFVDWVKELREEESEP